MKPPEKFEMIAKTFENLEDVLAGELKILNAENITVLKRAVKFTGDKKMMYQANYLLRTAISILKPIAQFNVKDEDDLYRNISRINWSHYLNINDGFMITAVSGSVLLKHSKYIAYKTKDAIVDQFRRKTGSRPSINTEQPDLIINIYIARDNQCSVALDSSGEPLFKRGYREDGLKAPLNEVLAAGMVLLTGWDGNTNLIDPMCGTGTIPIEAGMIACNIPAGKFRQQFGFQNWKDYDAALYEKIKEEAAIKTKTPQCRINGSDISAKAVEIANQNLDKTGLKKIININKISFEDYIPEDEGGFLITNPPYGERLKEEDINQFYAQMGSRLKHHYSGYHAWILSSNFEALNYIGLRPSQKIKLYNGSLECKFQEFRLYKGSKREK